MAKLNVALKMAILESGKKQRRVAALARIHPTELSAIVRQRRSASKEQRERLARVLGRSQNELFPELAVTA
jgi:plasmid maintenance system antidote protein VapI